MLPFTRGIVQENQLKYLVYDIPKEVILLSCVETLIKQHGRLSSTEEEWETPWIFDREPHHYQLAYLGWQGNARSCGPVLHFDIKPGKIWIQHNGTEFDVAEELMAMGVPRGDIVSSVNLSRREGYLDPVRFSTTSQQWRWIA